MRGMTLILGLSIAVGVPTAASAQEPMKPVVVGSWTFNVEKSDKPQEKIAQAMRAGGGRTANDGFGGGRAGGRSGGRSGGRGGAAGSGGGAEGVMEAGQRGNADGMRVMLNLLRGPARLVVERTDSTVVLRRDDLEPLSIFTDGRQVDLGGAEDTNRLTHKAEWKGSKLVVKTVVGENIEVEETYEIKGKDPAGLEVDVKVDNKEMGRSIKLKRVYDAAQPGG